MSGRPFQDCHDCGGERTESVFGKRAGVMVALCPTCKDAGSSMPLAVPPFLRKAMTSSARGRAHLRRIEGKQHR